VTYKELVFSAMVLLTVAFCFTQIRGCSEAEQKYFIEKSELLKAKEAAK